MLGWKGREAESFFKADLKTKDFAHKVKYHLKFVTTLIFVKSFHHYFLNNQFLLVKRGMLTEAVVPGYEGYSVNSTSDQVS